jgi:xanthine dehydrogenase molybdopterin-binding subunit B
MQGQAVQPLITLPEAIAAESYLPGIAGIKELKKGDTQQALATAPRTASGRILAGELFFLGACMEGRKSWSLEPVCFHRLTLLLLLLSPTGGQKHFYFEPQTCLAVPSEGGSLSLHLSTQAPSDTHTVVSKILDLPKHKVSVTTRRTGGGFGGKLTRCFQNAAAAALCAHRLRAPVRVANERSADFVLVGGREGMCFDYDVGFDEQGT